MRGRKHFSCRPLIFFLPKKLCSAWRMHKKSQSHGPKRRIRERAHAAGRQQKAKAGAGFACWRRPACRVESPNCRDFLSKRNAFQLCMKQGIVGNKRFPGKEVSSHLSVPLWPPVSKNNLMSRAEERLLSAYTLIFLLLWLTFCQFDCDF